MKEQLEKLVKIFKKYNLYIEEKTDSDFNEYVVTIVLSYDNWFTVHCNESYCYGVYKDFQPINDISDIIIVIEDLFNQNKLTPKKTWDNILSELYTI